MNKLIKIILTEQNYNCLSENQKAFQFFKKSDYWKYLKEDFTKFGKDSPDFKINVHHYAGLFFENTRALNLF
jgi:hypothetical protein